jgi:hypothetical protein
MGKSLTVCGFFTRHGIACSSFYLGVGVFATAEGEQNDFHDLFFGVSQLVAGAPFRSWLGLCHGLCHNGAIAAGVGQSGYIAG